MPIRFNIRRRIASALCIAAALAAPGLAGCGSSLVIPKPGAVPPLPLPPAEESVVEIPISVNLAGMFGEVERSVPASQRANDWTVATSNAVGDVGVRYELRRDPLQITLNRNTIHAQSRVRYWFQFAQRVEKPFVGGFFWQELGSCGVDEAPREAVVGMETKVGWTDNWALAPVSTVLPIQFGNRCEVTFLRFDITTKVNDAFSDGLKQGARLADNRIRELAQFRTIGEQVWKQLQDPIPLDSGLWLTMSPTGAFAGPLSGSGQSVSTVAGFTATPSVVFGAKPQLRSTPLPKLRTVEKTGNGFHVVVEGSLTYGQAGTMLAQALAADTFHMVGHEVRIVAASIYGAGAKAVVQLALAGDVNGTIYLIGTPAYDAARNEVYMRDLDYSLETHHALANAADWLLHGAFRENIAEGSHFPLADHIAGAKGRLEKALNRPLTPHITSHAIVGALRPIAVYTTESGFTARVAIDGALHLDVH
ncbi:MAG: DUF4403 family protein [Bacteroidetes bacterium]|nr:DUF4403 family protein [Bacteroidota bacterium]